MSEELRLLVLEPRPLAEHLRKRRITVENAYAAEDLLVANILRLGDIDEDVEVVASAILYKPRLPHVEQCITKPITVSMLLCQ